MLTVGLLVLLTIIRLLTVGLLVLLTIIRLLAVTLLALLAIIRLLAAGIVRTGIAVLAVFLSVSRPHHRRDRGIRCLGTSCTRCGTRSCACGSGCCFCSARCASYNTVNGCTDGGRCRRCTALNLRCCLIQCLCSILNRILNSVLYLVFGEISFRLCFLHFYGCSAVFAELHSFTDLFSAVFTKHKLPLPCLIGILYPRGV